MTPSSTDDPAVRHRLLVVVRHGRAESFAEEDHARRLTERGRRDAAALGEWLAASAGRLGLGWGVGVAAGWPACSTSRRPWASAASPSPSC